MSKLATFFLIALVLSFTVSEVVDAHHDGAAQTTSWEGCDGVGEPACNLRRKTLQAHVNYVKSHTNND
ncbi:hypothetical protein ACHQM5_010469 [Ranunculus cassubicifolius]